MTSLYKGIIFCCEMCYAHKGIDLKRMSSLKDDEMTAMSPRPILGNGGGQLPMCALSLRGGRYG